MPQPCCDVCGKRVPPDDRVTSPAELDDAGKVERPSTSWHTACLEDELDALSEAEEEEGWPMPPRPHLADPCDDPRCGHTYNWHASGGICAVPGCVCKSFAVQPAKEQP
jgi:hypothetical protein